MKEASREMLPMFPSTPPHLGHRDDDEDDSHDEEEDDAREETPPLSFLLTGNVNGRRGVTTTLLSRTSQCCLPPPASHRAPTRAAVALAAVEQETNMMVRPHTRARVHGARVTDVRENERECVRARWGEERVVSRFTTYP